MRSWNEPQYQKSHVCELTRKPTLFTNNNKMIWPKKLFSNAEIVKETSQREMSISRAGGHKSVLKRNDYSVKFDNAESSATLQGIWEIRYKLLKLK